MDNATEWDPKRSPITVKRKNGNGAETCFEYHAVYVADAGMWFIIIGGKAVRIDPKEWEQCK